MPNILQPQRGQGDGQVDLFGGAKLWSGAALYVNGEMWQGFGFSDVHGVEGFPNGDAFKVGTKVPNVTFARVFLRQTIGLGGEQEIVTDDSLHLAGRVDVLRVTLTLGKLSAKDIFDNNAYANDPRTQFLSWNFLANAAWDFPALDYQFIHHPAFNRDSGPVSVISARVHFDF